MGNDIILQFKVLLIKIKNYINRTNVNVRVIYCNVSIR